MRYYIIFLVVIFQISCQTQKSSDISDDEKRYGTETKIFGDSLKIIYEYKGDTVIQNRIDLKGVSDDGFDSSFRVVIVWSTYFPTQLDCDKTLNFNDEKVAFEFCLKSVIEKVENDIKRNSEKPWMTKGSVNLLNELNQIKSNYRDHLTYNSIILALELIKNGELEFIAFDKKTNKVIKKIRIGNYETNFSGGKNFEIISSDNDTIQTFSINEWMH